MRGFPATVGVAPHAVSIAASAPSTGQVLHRRVEERRGSRVCRLLSRRPARADAAAITRSR